MDKIHILGVAGSLREGSYDRKLLRAANELLPEGMSLEVFEIEGIPLYNADLEQDGTPEPVERFKKRELPPRMRLLIASPEYNWGMPGVLKNAIDWVSVLFKLRRWVTSPLL